jgi:hypothetical protein
VGKTSRFRPTPAEIRAAAEIEFEQASKPKQLEAPKLSQEERDAAMEETSWHQLEEGQRATPLTIQDLWK